DLVRRGVWRRADVCARHRAGRVRRRAAAFVGGRDSGGVARARTDIRQRVADCADLDVRRLGRALAAGSAPRAGQAEGTVHRKVARSFTGEAYLMNRAKRQSWSAIVRY